METQARCKGCKNYLIVPPGQPCSICNTVNKPSKKGHRQILPRILQFVDGYAKNNLYNPPYGQPVQPTPYAGYYSQPAYGSGYYTPPPQQPPVAAGYYNLPQQAGYYNNNYHQSPPVHERKRAVLCGVTYKGHKKTLPASVTNVRSMHQLLLKFGFPNASIHVLTEDESDPTRTPTRHNILTALEWLTRGCQSGDSLVFYYAGHGSHVPDANGDEKDGLDEAICPVDYNLSGKILDDEVNAILVAPLPHGSILHSIMDTCYSGTLLDLPFLCRVDRGDFISGNITIPHMFHQVEVLVVEKQSVLVLVMTIRIQQIHQLSQAMPLVH